MTEPLVKFEKQGNIAIFTLNRPNAMNAISAELAQEFENHMETFEADSSLWVGIVASSHPKTFCAGADLKSINAGKPVMTAKGGFAGFVKFPRKKPMIAAVDGFALAGGFEIALACDMIVASEVSKFAVPEVKRSLTCAAGGLFRLPRKIPENIAMEMILTGDRITAGKAHKFGLVNYLCPKGKSLEEALKLAARITVNAPLAVFESKRVVTDALLKEEEERAWIESTKSFPYLMSTEDFYEGPKAFIEKRKPKWTGKLRSKL